jgi:uncharacterized 2Fe-2S/4Fe-4S cluster protein (DUF4445 family)
MIRDLLAAHKLDPSLLVRISIVGNTTMMHLLLGIDPSGIAAAPFIPIATHAMEFPAVEIGFTSCTAATIEIPGSVASYVGADITAGIYACACTAQPKPVLFLDIGTNGEMAVWTGERIVCCSSAAGPAFEGASIHHGTGGIEGAISKLVPTAGPDGDRAIRWETIGNSAPVGICGSGIIDAVAILLDMGLVDETGAMSDPDSDLIIDTPQGPALNIVASHSDPVYLTHKDVREVQLAKAAVAAGVHTLLEYCNLGIEDLSEVVIAGGFGSYIDIDHAQRIGLIVPVDRNIIKSVGNAAGKGAVMMLLDPESHDRIDAIARGSHYIELSGSAVFMEHYIDQMAFESKE